MAKMMHKRFDLQNLMVIAPPRSGFTLLLSILNLIKRDYSSTYSLPRLYADKIVSCYSLVFDQVLRFHLSQYNGIDCLYYNKEFAKLTGGPKWLSSNSSSLEDLCVRKYVGLQGLGDFTFILYLPTWLQELDEIAHSHSHPSKWVNHTDYTSFKKFSSVRNPVDIVHSSVFSINALASEYIQRNVTTEEHIIRRELAFNKLTNLPFIAGLADFLKSYFDEFIPVADNYLYTMRWEDLIEKPHDTIKSISKSLSLDLTSSQISSIWSEIDHRNLTKYHKHSFRRGLLDQWKNTLVNEHIEIFKNAGFDQILSVFGYPSLEYFDNASYTSEQSFLDGLIKNRQIYVEDLDADLIKFAFNKTNYVARKSDNFSSYQRQGSISIERSSILGDDVAHSFLDVFSELSSSMYRSLLNLESIYRSNSTNFMDYLDCLLSWINSISSSQLSLTNRHFLSLSIDQLLRDTPPQLVEQKESVNIVFWQSRLLEVPHTLGPLNLADFVSIENLPSSIKIINSTK